MLRNHSRPRFLVAEEIRNVPVSVMLEYWSEKIEEHQSEGHVHKDVDDHKRHRDLPWDSHVTSPRLWIHDGVGMKPGVDDDTTTGDYHEEHTSNVHPITATRDVWRANDMNALNKEYIASRIFSNCSPQGWWYRANIALFAIA